MRRLGTVDRVGQGLAVLAVSEAPSIGTAVLDEALDEVGTVVDVFGPVDRPYVAVSTAEDRNPASLLGDPLYVR